MFHCCWRGVRSPKPYVTKCHSVLNLPQLISRPVSTTTLRGSEPAQHEGNICDQTWVGWFDSTICCQEQQGRGAGNVAASQLHSPRFRPELGHLHVLSVSLWVSSRFFSVVYLFKNMLKWLPLGTKLPLGANVSACWPLKAWHPIEGWIQIDR